MEKAKGRPPIYSDEARAFVSATGKTKLQSGSERRAIINALIDAGGSMTLGALDRKFGYNIRGRVLALERCGWLRIEDPEKECPYCEPDGTERNGDNERICRHCGGTHFLARKEEKK